MTAPLTAALAISNCCRANEKVLVVTAVTAYVPSYGLPTPATKTELPTMKLCGLCVVIVATPEVKEALVTLIPRRISLAPPPPPPVPVPLPPPFQPPTIGS